MHYGVNNQLNLEISLYFMNVLLLGYTSSASPQVGN